MGQWQGPSSPQKATRQRAGNGGSYCAIGRTTETDGELIQATQDVLSGFQGSRVLGLFPQLLGGATSCTPYR
eukprot:537329-Pyramimonas_sp.AAC.1